MVSFVSWGCSDQADSGIVIPGSFLCGMDRVGAHLKPFLVPAQAQGRTDHTGEARACFQTRLATNRDREIGGGRATRQPGQVRKEAALTRSGSSRSSVSYLVFRANQRRRHQPPARSFPQKPATRHFIADRLMTDAGAPPN